MPVDADWSDVFDDLSTGSKSNADSDELRDFMDANLQGSRSLHDHLIEQAQMAPFSEREAAVAEYLIDSINDDGYLADWPELSADRKSVGEGKSVSVRLDLGGGRIIQKKKKNN